MITLIMSLGVLSAQDASIIATQNGKTITLEKMAKELKKYDLIFFGEYHENAIIHGLQSQLLPLLYKNNKRLILSFEMFERDAQESVDSYLAGDINEEEFLGTSNPWPNYPTDYRPLIEFARDKRLKVIAANIPRRLAGLVARNGTQALDELSLDDKMLMALEVSAPEGEYKDKFLATMQANGMHAMPGDNQMMERLFYAQCMKDDTMAESIAQYRECHPKHQIIHFNGDFHSRAFLGTVERLKSRMPKLKIAVISPEYIGYDWPENPAKQASYLIQIPAPSPEED